MPDKLFTLAILASVNIQILQYPNFFANQWEYSYPKFLQSFNANFSRKLCLQHINVIKKWISIWATHMKLGGGEAGRWCYLCPETTVSLQNQCYLKANINKFRNKFLLHVLLHFPVWHHKMLISSHLTILISCCLAIWLAHPRLIPILFFQESLNLLMEVLSAVKFGLQENFSFKI